MPVPTQREASIDALPPIHPGERYRVVWFKRDLRAHDHAALTEAARVGPVLCLYVAEPELWRQPETSRMQARFVSASLRDLDAALRALGGRLEIVAGSAVEVFARLHAHAPMAAIHAHEETGGAWTFARDRAVARWCRRHGVAFVEHAQTGVVRGLRERDGWSRRWNRFMAQPLEQACALAARSLPWTRETVDLVALAAHADDAAEAQAGGREAGLHTLRTFLDERVAGYRGGISSPLSAPTACSRLSPYLAQGCLSMREVVQATARVLEDKNLEARTRQGLRAFIGRLHWHCHFMQKLESEPEIETHNFHRGFDGLREHEWNAAHFEALIHARSGWPMVDACVAMLRHSGWLNFRMRAMLVSVAAFPLWLHWRPFGLWLARQFVDYEPGIHWSQLQMQSGTTGINTARVYSPVKQAQDHDPDGAFVRRWLPYMRDVPDTHLFEPWQWRCGYGERLPPRPVVDLRAATQAAKQRYYARRRAPGMRETAEAVLEKHGSRRRPAGQPRRSASGDDGPRRATARSSTPRSSTLPAADSKAARKGLVRPKDDRQLDLPW